MLLRAAFGCLLALAILASPALLAQEVSPETSERFTKALRKLGSDDYDLRQEGSAELAALPAEALRLVDAALKKGDLELEVQTRLQAAIPKLKVKVRREALARTDDAVRSWARKSALEAYSQAGRMDPRWDAKAKECLALMSLVWGEPKKNHSDLMKQAWTLSEEAIRAGCNDPLVVYCHARQYDSIVRKDYQEALRLHLEAARMMKESGGKYHPLRQAYPFARAAEFILRSKKQPSDDDRKEAQDWLERAVDKLGEGARDIEVPESDLLDCAEVMLSPWNILAKDRKVGFDRAAEALAKARPKSALPLILKGSVYTDYAWDARGGGWANTVTPEGWKLMKERLAEAEEALTKAWQMNPEDPRAPTLMIGVELGQGKGVPVMEQWYSRAMQADPDNWDACSKKMYYLEPKWYGGPDQMLAFGRELLAQGHWERRLPFKLIEAHLTLADYEKDSASYYKDEAVWRDIRAVYDRYLALHPNSTYDQTFYAKLACWCGHWDVARKLFETLGDRVEVSAFADRAELERLRAQALPPVPPPAPARGAPIDLLGKIDPTKDAVSGSWKFDGKALVSPSADFSRLEVSLQVPEEYDLEVVAQRSATEKADTLAIGLLGIRGPFMIGLDGNMGSRSGIDAIDGKRFVENESTREGALFPPDKEVTVRVAVRKNRVIAIIEGKPVLDWKADYSRLSMRPAWAVRDARALFLGCNKCVYRITKWELIPLAP